MARQDRLESLQCMGDALASSHGSNAFVLQLMHMGSYATFAGRPRHSANPSQEGCRGKTCDESQRWRLDVPRPGRPGGRRRAQASVSDDLMAAHTAGLHAPMLASADSQAGMAAAGARTARSLGSETYVGDLS